MGPNGAGKSTLVRILGGLLLPSAGTASVGGIDAGTGGSAFRRRVAFVVGDERSFQYRLSGRRTCTTSRRCTACRGEARRRAAALLERVGLADAADRRYREYSRGMRSGWRSRAGCSPIRRCCCSTSRRWASIRAARATCARSCARGDSHSGRTAIVCSNDPTEARALADCVLFLEGGKLHADAPPGRIEAELGL